MKALLKRWLFAVAPRWTTALVSARARAHSHRVLRDWGYSRLTDKLVAHLGPAVQEGPFAGLTLGPMARQEHLGPFLLGVYESELDPAWEVVLAGQYSQVVDVGAKFGYYAVGLARRYPAAEVVAFDTDPWARRAVGETARLNGVANVRVRGFCDRRWLRTGLRDGALIVSDCEGYEAELFGDPLPDRLATATLLVESHDDAVPGVSGRLQQSFGPTHVVTVLRSGEGRRASSLPLAFLTEQEWQQANCEIRPSQMWLLALPRAGPNRHLQESVPPAAVKP